MQPFRSWSSSSSQISSSPSSPTLFGKKWAEPTLQLPTSLPIRYPQKLRTPSRRVLILLTLATLAFLAFLTRSLPDSESTGRVFQHWTDLYSSSSYNDCRLNTSTLQSYGLTDQYSYTRRYIKQVPYENGPDSKSDLAFVKELDHNIFSGMDYLSTSAHQEGSIVDLQQCSPEPMKMYLKQQRKIADARHLVFGMATTAERLLDVASTTALWLSHTGARLIVLIPSSPRTDELREHLANLGILATVVTSDEDFLFNYFKLVEAFHENGQPESHWFTFIDDDTHYFSLQRFIDNLNVYDYNKEWYIGNPTEDLRMMRADGIFAFGGAGITVSKSLLNHMHEEYFSCIRDHPPWLSGDVRVKRCINQHTNAKLTNMEGLHQVDLIGNSDGVLEGPRPPINWHHWRSWSPQVPGLISLAGQLCGGACLFQRWKFPIPADFGYSFMTFHFGVSFVGYADGIRPDLSQTEATWEVYPESNFDHSIAPMRMGLKEGRDRFTYKIKGISKDIDGHVKHTYIKYVDREKLAKMQAEGKAKEVKSGELEVQRSLVSEIDEVMELIFI